MATISKYGIVLNFSNDLDNITLDGKVIATGGCTFYSDPTAWSLNPLPCMLEGKLLSKNVVVINSNSVKVTHSFENAIASYTYKLIDNNLSLDIKIQHNGSNKDPIRYICFNMPIFHFNRVPDNNLTSWHRSYTQANGEKLMHPSLWNPIGCSYINDNKLGIGVWTKKHFQSQKMFSAVWQREGITADVGLIYSVKDQINQSDVKSFDIQLKISKNVDWKNLLSDYKNYYFSVLPQQQYISDQRPIAQFASADSSWVNDNNPYGFNGDTRRFDKVEGTQAFINMVAVPLSAANGQGCIFWALGGYNPRGVMYRPDFDVFPPEIAANIPALVKGFKDRGLRAGLCTRPGEGVSPSNWTTDLSFRLSSQSTDQINVLLQRFKNVTDMGFNLFYLDTFGNTIDDIEIMKQIRSIIGTSPTFCEYSCDLILPYTGRYVEYNNGYAWSNQWQFDFYMWLMPTTSFATVARSPLTYDQMGQMKLLPFVEDYLTSELAPQLKAYTDKYITNGGWKNIIQSVITQAPINNPVVVSTDNEK